LQFAIDQSDETLHYHFTFE